MKIIAVEVYRVRIPAAEPSYIWRRGLPGSSPDGYGAVLLLRTDAGCDGVAFAPRLASSAILPDIVDRHLHDLLLGEDPFQRELLWHQVWELDRVEEMPLYLLGTVDIALWDLAGRAYGVPTWQVLGRRSGPRSRRMRPRRHSAASRSTWTLRTSAWSSATQLSSCTPSEIAGRMRSCAPPLRKHVGDDIPLMYDGSAGFDLPDAVYLGDALSDAGYLWYEEPIREFSVTSYKWLAERTSAPLLVGETSDGAHMNTADFIASGCASFVRTSAELRGGFTGAMRTAHLADSFRLRAEPHGNTITSRHLCMAIPNCTYYESLVWGNPVQREAGIDDHGIVRAPRGPGIGLPAGPDYPETLEKFVVDL